MSIRCASCRAENPETSRYCSSCGTSLTTGASGSRLPDLTETIRTLPHILEPGQTVAGRYKVIDDLGRGGMGRVYKVYDTKVKEKIALKLIRNEVAGDVEALERFGNELKLARQIVSRSVCRMYDLGEADGTHFLTMEYVPGEDLRALARKVVRFSPAQAVAIARQVCEGLVEAHRAGVVHRDLKPSNIMIDDQGTARILDFGIASSFQTKGLTAAGVVVGTAEYMSPEQIAGKDVDARADIYALGVILYEMLTGRVPFEGDSPLTVGVKHKTEAPLDPRQIVAAVPEELARLVLRCLEKDRTKRFQTAEELLAELQRIEKSLPTTARKAVRKPLTSREYTVKFTLRKLLAPALILAALGAAVAGWLILRGKGGGLPPGQRRSIAVVSFENLTGENAYDGLSKVIPTLLITNLENSRLFDVVTWERLHDLIKKIGKPDVDFIDRELGFELCREDGVDAIVLGTVAKAGYTFATDVKVYDVASKTLLKSANARGEGAESILRSQIDELTREIELGVGTPEKRVEAAPSKVADLTTSSIKAYDHFLTGREEYDKLYYGDALKSFEKAVEIDPEFAVAYLFLARSRGELGERAGSLQAYEQAKAHAGRASEKERLYIEEAYAGAVERDGKKRLGLLLELVKKYPKEKFARFELGNHYFALGRYEEAAAEMKKALALDAHYGLALNQLAYAYANMGQPEKALPLFEKYAAMAPGDANPVDSMAETYFRLGDYDRAAEKYQEALRIKPDFVNACWGLAYVSALKEDYAKALSWADQFILLAPTLGIKGQGYFYKSFLNLWLGRYGQVVDEMDWLKGLSSSMGYGQGIAAGDLLAGWALIERGELDRGRERLISFMDAPPEAGGVGGSTSPNAEAIRAYLMGTIDLRAGRVEDARTAQTRMEALLPKIEAPSRPGLAYPSSQWRGEILLAEGKADEAIAVLLEAPGRGMPPNIREILPFYNLPFERDALARAHALKGENGKAAAIYEKLLAPDPKDPARMLIHPLYHYRLAALYEKLGRKDRARAEYERFLAVWKDADPARPEPADARARLKAL
ncbi:MAG: protein kinase [Candidatus Aminicenantes bacterium]|nr:protein kinase [Candidatus Aminicenantes bacterium]